MNQILNLPQMDIMEEQPYRFPKEKNLVPKFAFVGIMVAVFISSCYIYATYDWEENNTQNNISSELSSVYNEINEQAAELVKENRVEIVAEPKIEIEEEKKANKKDTNNGVYEVAYLKIPKINVNLPVLSKYTEELLDKGLNKFWGCEPNEIGNFCIVGHNYKNLFIDVPKLEIGNTLELTDQAGRTVKYKVYDKYIVVPEDTSCTSQLTEGRKEVTLITCTVNGKKRVIIKAMEVK